MKMKWIVVAGLALAMPAMTVLSGCSGGNGLTNTGGAASQFAGVTGSGPLFRNGAQVGLVGFTVNNNGVITGTLNTLQQNQIARANLPRAAVTASSNVASNGSFSLVFNTSINGVAQSITFAGTISRSGSTASVTNVNVTSSVEGAPFSLNLTVTVAASGGGGSASGTFSVAGGNATGGNLSSNAGIATAVRANGKIISLSATFVSASTSGARSVAVFLTPTNDIVAGPINIASGDASVTYTEVPTANPSGGKTFVSDTGTVRVDSISATQIKVTLLDVKATPVPGLAGTGTVTITGSGTATIQ